MDGCKVLVSGSISIVLHPKLSISHLFSKTTGIHPFTYLFIYASTILYSYIDLLSLSQLGYCYPPNSYLNTKRNSIGF